MNEKEALEGLELKPGASRKEIRAAYAKLCKKYHPEESPVEFVQLNEAYKTALKNVEQADTAAETDRGAGKRLSEEQAEKKDFEKQAEKAGEIESKTKEFESERALRKEREKVSEAEREMEEKEEENFPEENTAPASFSMKDLWQQRIDSLDAWLEEYQRLLDRWEYRGLALPSRQMPEHITYIRENPLETEEERESIERLFADEIWDDISRDEELLEYMMESAAIQILPRRMAEKLYQTYAGQLSFDETGKKAAFVEYLMGLLSFYRRLPEYNCYAACDFPEADIAKIRLENGEFWQYFLMTGYDGRGGEAVSPLRALMKHIYQPSMEWRKQFCGYIDGKEEEPKTYDILLADGKRVTVVFHLHHIEYMVNGQAATAPVFSYKQLCNYSQSLQREEDFFFLLGMTYLRETEKSEAMQELAKRLQRLPLYDVTIPAIAQYLAENCSVTEEELRELQGLTALLYDETERFCFRIKMKVRSMELTRLTENGWVKMELLSGEGKAYKTASSVQEKRALAEKKLYALRQPEPVELKRFSLEGMNRVQKSAAVADALRYRGKEYRKICGGKAAYVPGFPAWSSDELTPAVYEFFAKDGGYILNDYVLLHIGTQKRPCCYKLFHISMGIFSCHYPQELEEAYGILAGRFERMLPPWAVPVGRIGWGTEGVPVPIAVGVDGTLYSCRSSVLESSNFMQKEGLLVQAGSLEELLAVLFDFSDVTEILTYEGRITLSRLDGQLEYCYSNEDNEKYLYTEERTRLRMFSDFWGA